MQSQIKSNYSGSYEWRSAGGSPADFENSFSRAGPPALRLPGDFTGVGTAIESPKLVKPSSASKPVQWKMPVNEFVIAVIFEKIHAMLNNNGRN